MAGNADTNLHVARPQFRAKRRPRQPPRDADSNHPAPRRKREADWARADAKPDGKDFSESPSAPGKLSWIGGGGIRTPDTVSRVTVFKTVAFSRSATPPESTEGHSLPPPSPGLSAAPLHQCSTISSVSLTVNDASPGRPVRREDKARRKRSDPAATVGVFQMMISRLIEGEEGARPPRRPWAVAPWDPYGRARCGRTSVPAERRGPWRQTSQW